MLSPKVTNSNMGNTSSTEVIQPKNGVVISTRSEAPPGRRVVKELGMISALAGGQESAALPNEVANNASKQCSDLGGDVLLGAQTQVMLRNSSNFKDYVHLVATCVVTEKTGGK